MELGKLKAIVGTFRAKIEDFRKLDEDKLVLIKLQN